MYEGARIENDSAQTSRKQKYRDTGILTWKPEMGKTTWSSETPKTNHYDERNTTRKLVGNDLDLFFVHRRMYNSSHALSLSSFRDNNYYYLFQQ